MPLSLQQTQIIAEIAALLVDFLPGKPFPDANSPISFPGVARAVGLEAFWPGGSKTSALTYMLSKTLAHRQAKFCTLVLNIVVRGIPYRRKKNDPVSRSEIDALNAHLLALGFKVRDLHDAKFLDGLPRFRVTTVSATSSGVPSAGQLGELRRAFDALKSLPPQTRGLEFERFLNEQFAVFV